MSAMQMGMVAAYHCVGEATVDLKKMGWSL